MYISDIYPYFLEIVRDYTKRYNNYSEQLLKAIQMSIDIKSNVSIQQYIILQSTIVDEFWFTIITYIYIYTNKCKPLYAEQVLTHTH